MAWRNAMRLNPLRNSKCIKWSRLEVVSPVLARNFSSTRKDNIVPSPYPDIDLQHGIPISHFIMEHFSKYGQAEALVNGVTGERFTYNRLQDLVTRVASSLTRMGIKKGDVVTIFSSNSPEFAIFFLAVGYIGAVISPLNPLYKAAELSHALKSSGSTLVATSPHLVGITKEAIKNNSTDVGIITFGQSEGCRPFSSMLEDDGTLCPTSIDVNYKEDMAQLPYSSGTTGLPKGIMLTHSNLVSNIQQILSDKVVNYRSLEETLIGVLPFFHIYGGVINMLSGLRHGVKIVTMPKFDLISFLEIIEKYKATFIHIVPPMVIDLAKHEAVDKFKLKSVHTFFTAAAPIGQEMAQAVLERFNNPELKFRQGYGLTETSPLTHATPHGCQKLASIGVPLPNIITKVIDIQTGEPLGPDKEGEICVAGPMVMKGYYNNPKATAETIKDGWLHTGDVGYYDKDSLYYVTDRIKELIKVKGYQVAPAELEALLNTHPAVADVAVVGIPDERSGELPRAYCVLKPGMKASEAEIQEFAKDRLAPYKRLAGGVEFISSVPKTNSGKIQRRVLKLQYLEDQKK